MKILWANRYCLFDTSSGASISAREILLELARLGHDVEVLGATVFDSPAGSALINNAIAKHDASQKKTVKIQDDGFKHHLVVTKSTSAGLMSLDELNLLYAHYRKLLTEFKPDVVLFYGGNSFDMLLPVEAKKHGALTAAYLVNANYVGERWSEDVDLIFTDSRATAKFYKDKVGLEVIPIGTIINPSRVVAPSRDPKRITFINPSLSKGAAIVAQLAESMESARPEIVFEVVESRGSWNEIVKSVLGREQALGNVIVSPNTNNIADIYSRSRILLAPSLWWESGARVLAEAALNGIPQITTDYGGSPEMVAEGGIVIRLPAEMHEAPYHKLLSQPLVAQISGVLLNLFDDEGRYQDLSARALQVAARQHNRQANIRIIEAALQVCISRKSEQPPSGSSFHRVGATLIETLADKSADEQCAHSNLLQSSDSDLPFIQQLYREVGEILSLGQFNILTSYNRNADCCLAKLCEQYGSDKGALNARPKPYPWPAHTYTDFYSRLWGHCRQKVEKVFECGIGTNNPSLPSSMGARGKPGASLRVWRDYFVNAEIFGADIDRNILFSEDRIRTFYVDQLSHDSVIAMWRKIELRNFDFIIDDGLHTFEAGVCLFEGSIERLAHDGLHVIEDVTPMDMEKYRHYFAAKPYVVEYVNLFRPGLPCGDNRLVVIRKQ